MEAAKAYVLGDTVRAARRLEIQDAHFADLSGACWTAWRCSPETE